MPFRIESVDGGARAGVIRTAHGDVPTPFFMPVATALLLLGLVKLGADLVRFNFHVAGSTIMIVTTAVQVAAIGLLADLIVKRTRLE